MAGYDFTSKAPEVGEIPYDFGDGFTATAVDAITAGKRADKWQFGLAEMSPGRDSLYNQIITGKEQQEAKIQAQRQDFIDVNFRDNVLRERILSGDIEPEEIDNFLSGAAANPHWDYFEKKYSSRMVTMAAEKVTNARNLTEADHQAMDQAQKALHLKEGAQKIAENLKAEYDAKGLPAKIEPNLERFIPLLYDARMRANFWAFTGSDLKAQYDNYFLMDNPSDALRMIEAESRARFAANPSAALDWLHGFSAFSSSDVALGNIFTAIDFGTVPGVGLGASALRRSLKATIKANANRTTDTVQILEDLGDLKTSTRLLAQRQVDREAVQGGPRSLDELRGQTVSMQSGPTAFEGNNLALSREGAQRIKAMMDDNKRLLEANLEEGPIKVQRLEDGSNALKVAERETDELFNLNYANISDRILDVRTSKLDDAITSNRFRIFALGEAEGGKAVEGLDATARYRPGSKGPFKTLRPSNDDYTITFGDAWVKPFKTLEAAERAAREDYKLGAFEVVPRANGYVVEVKKAIDETLPSVRNALRIETGADTPKGLGQILRAVLPLSKNAKLAPEIMEAAAIAGYGTKNQQALVNSLMKPIDALRKTAGKKDWENFNTFLDRQRLTKTEDGYGRFSENFHDLETEWHKQFGKFPNEAEQKAYWSYVQLNDAEYVINNLGIYRDKTRQGRAMYTLPNNEMAVPAIEGKMVQHFPWDTPAETNFLLWDKDISGVRRLSNFDSNPGESWAKKYNVVGKEAEGTRTSSVFREWLDKGIQAGELKVIQLARYSEDELRTALGARELPKGRIDYIVTRDVQETPLKLWQLPYQPGGHHAYEYSWYVRQPVLDVGKGEIRRRTTYRGDTNLVGMNTEKDVKEFTRRMNVARDIFKRGLDENATPNAKANAVVELDTYLNRNLPFDLEHFQKLFKSHKGQFDVDTPFYHTPNAKTTDAFHKLEDVIKRGDPNVTYLRSSESPHNLDAGQINLRYASERGDPLYASENIGTKANPAFNFQRAKMIEPMAIADRAARTIANSVILDDLKIKAAERFIAEFSDTLVWNIAEIRRNPLRALMEAPFKPGVLDVDKWAAMDVRRSTLELLGMRTDTQVRIDSIVQKLSETIYSTKVGKKIADSEWTPTWMIPAIKDPAKAVRKIAFETHLGMFNPTSLVNQAMIVNHIAGVEGPIRAIKSIQTGQMMSMLRFSEDNADWINHFAKLQSKTGLSVEHFKEAFEGLKQSGFHKVGREMIDHNEWMTAGLTEGRFGTFLEYGKAFYKRGEEIGRYTGYVAAYDKWRTANPKALFDSAAKAEVLNRADLLNLNMSGISNSVLQKGLPGVITQFFNAHLRQAEQILGGRLSRAEMFRLVTWNSLIYGLPMGLGGAATAGLWPVKQTATEYGLKAEDKFGWRADDHILTDVLMNGLMAVIPEQVGSTKFDTGNLGLGGVSIFRDFWHGNKSNAELAAGVAGRTMNDMAKATMPFVRSVVSLGDYKLKFEDWVDASKILSSASAVEKAYSAIFLGKYFGKTEQPIENITASAGIIMAITGMQTQDISEMYALLANEKQLKKYQDDVTKTYSLYIRRAFADLDKNNDEGFADWFKRADIEFKRGGFLESDRQMMTRRALDDSAVLVDRAFKKHLERTRENPEALDNFRKRLERRGM